MKKNLIACLFLILGSLYVHAQKITTAKVPIAVKAAFTNAHPGISGSWEMEGKNYEVNYKEGGKTVSSIIDKQGTILETETEIPLTELPQAAQNYLKQHYRAAKVKEVAKIVKSNGEVEYETLINGKDLMFDANGNYKKTSKEPKEKD